jgi:hypothetical protein
MAQRAKRESGMSEMTEITDAKKRQPKAMKGSGNQLIFQVWETSGKTPLMRSAMYVFEYKELRLQVRQNGREIYLESWVIG